MLGLPWLTAITGGEPLPLVVGAGELLAGDGGAGNDNKRRQRGPELL